MSRREDTVEQLRNALINEAEFQSDLVERDYNFAQRKRIPLAAFAYRPLDARSACVGVLTSNDPRNSISEYRELGAPLLLINTESSIELWRVGPNPERDERIESNLSVDGTARFFKDNPNTLRPLRLYAAKTVSRVDKSQRQLNLFSNFVDTDLLPTIENKVGEKLTSSVVSGILNLIKQFGSEDWIIKAVFRLLAGKILRDKSVPGFKSATLSHVNELLRKVERHYGSKNPLQLSDDKIESLSDVMTEIQSLGDLRNLTTESLGDVYERALITPEIRKIHGTHKTPGYLVDYVVWQLAKWIEEIPIDKLRFFEPGCGHAPFLVAIMRLLRTFDKPIPRFSQFVRERFIGIDNDPFALEIARLSLTVADEPNHNGWVGIREADMYAEGVLEKAASQSTVLISNPPYEKWQAEELLNRTLPFLPVGAVFAAIVPSSLLFSEKNLSVNVREWILKNCQLAEVDLFPDGLFTFGDHECALLAGRILPQSGPADSLLTRLRRVSDNDSGRKAFQLDYRFSTTRYFPQSAFGNQKEHPLWLAEHKNEIWRYLAHCTLLSAHANVNKGLEHHGIHLGPNMPTVLKDAFPGSVEGYSSCAGNWGIHEHPALVHLNLADEVVRTRGTGADGVPQVLLNHSPASRGVWRLKPFLDLAGHPFRSSVMSIRLTSEPIPYEFIWAVLAGPIANLFMQAHSLKRHNLPKTVGRIPFPTGSTLDIERTANIARLYINRANKGKHSLWNPDGYRTPELTNLLFKLDAAVLRLYGLPASAERILLEQFRGEQRPGVPVPFTEYYPADTPDVPLYAYLSDSYQRAMSGGSPELPAKDLQRYKALCEKADSGRLTQKEDDRLYELQAEIDGRDFWMMYQGKSESPIVQSTTPDEFDIRLQVLSDRAASESIKRSWK